MKNTFGEAYTIKAIYQKEDSYWEHIETTQLVQVIHGVNEKCNHQKAKELFLKENKHLKNLKVNSTIYQ
jgi:hypothetical protein